MSDAIRCGQCRWWAGRADEGNCELSPPVTPEQHTQWPDIVYLGEVTCRIRTERVNPKSLWLMHPPYDRR